MAATVKAKVGPTNAESKVSVLPTSVTPAVAPAAVLSCVMNVWWSTPSLAVPPPVTSTDAV